MLRGSLLALVAVVLVAACGGGNGASTAIAPVAIPSSTSPSTGGALQQDAEAKASARTAETLVEACYANANGQTFVGCNTPPALGPDTPSLGAGPGQVQLKLSTQGYTITAHSRSGEAFMLTRSASGSVQRACAGPDHAGDCHGGSW